MTSTLPWLVDNASRMAGLSRFTAAEPSSAYQSESDFVSDHGETHGMLETKSERSRYYDADSDGGGFSTNASEIDPSDEATSMLPKGTASPGSGAGSLRSSGQQTHLPEASPAVMLGKIHELQSQREEMNRQLFSLQRSHETLQQDNVSLTTQNTTLQQQNHHLRQQVTTLQQERQEMQDQMVVARTTENMMGRVVASDLVASDMIPQIMGYRRSLEHLRARRQQEEDARQAQVAKDGTFSGLLRSAAPWVVAVALGATSILVLDFIMQEDDAKRLLRQRA